MEKQKLFNLVLKAFLLLSPIFFFRDYQPSLAKGMFLIAGSFVLFGLSLSLKAKRQFSNPWVSIFLLLALARTFIGNDMGDSEWFNFWMSFAGFIYILSGTLLFYVVYSYAEDIKQYFKPILIVCILNLILVSAQFYNHDFMWVNTHPLGKICGFLETPAQLGQYSAMSLPILFFINPFLAIIPLFTLLLSKSVTPIISLFSVMMVVCFKFKNKILLIGITLSILVLIGFNFSYIRHKFEPRLPLWEKTLSSALKKPYVGWGYSSSGKLGNLKDSPVHNDYLQTAKELGFPILACIAMFFVGLFKKFRIVRNKDKLIYCLLTSVIIVLLNMSGQTLIRFASMAGTWIVLLALFCIKINQEIVNG